MDESVYHERMNKVRKVMAGEGIDVFFVSPSANFFYLSGYSGKADERLLLLALPLEGEPFVLANLLYVEQVKKLPVPCQVYWKDGDDPFSLLASETKERNITVKKAALEAKLPFYFYHELQKAFSAARFTPGAVLTDNLRKYKDERELALIRAACRASDEAFQALTVNMKSFIGKSETDFAEALQAELRTRGVSSFGASIQAGENAAVPHHQSGAARIERGKCLLADFWGRYGGYYTDCTRNLHFGRPGADYLKVHRIVLEAQRAGMAAARIGNTLGDVDFAARSVIEEAGYGEYFTHRTGHGIGIDVHEGDSANKGSEVPLEKGMVFSVEPGIYLPGRFGVRIENLVTPGENGAESFHSFDPHLLCAE